MTAFTPKSATRERQKADTRGRLIAAAKALFSAEGAGAVSVETVAEAAGVTRATFYLHFSGKPALLTLLAQEMWEAGKSHYEALARLPDWSEASLKGWLAAVIADWKAEGALTKAMMESMFSELARGRQDYLRACVEALTAEPARWPGLPHDEAERRAFLLVTQVESALTAWILGGWTAEKEAMIASIARVLANLVQTKNS